jgi:outer membrane protein assembly factor BamB
LTTKLPVITPSTYYAVGGEPLTEPTMTAITMYNGTAYADSNFLGVLFAVNATDGAIRWMFNTGQCESNPNIHDGYLYIMNDVGILYVLNASDGALVNELNTGMHHLSNEITIAKNKIILTSLNGSVVTIPISRLTNPSQ